MPRLTCREFVEFLDRYLDGDLPPETMARFNEHLSRCPACVNYLGGYRASTDAARATLACEDELDTHDLPEGLVEAILAVRRRTT